MNSILEKLQLRLPMIFNPQFVVTDFLKLVLISLFIFFTGYLCTRLLMRNGLKLNFLEVIGTSYLLGFGIIPFITLIYSVFSVKLQFLYLLMPILIIDIILFSFTFPKNLELKSIKSFFYDFHRKVKEKKDVLFFFLIIYTIVFSLVLFPLFRGVYLGSRYDAGRYAIAAEQILQGNSPFSTEVYSYGAGSKFEYGRLWIYSYTLFYLLTLASLAVLSGIGDAITVSYLFGPTFSISGLPLTAYILLSRFRESNSPDRSIAKIGVFLIVFVSEEIVFWSLFGKGTIVAISYILMSLHFLIKMLQRREGDEEFAKNNKRINFEVILSGLLAGIASLYHIAAFIFVLIIAFFLLSEFLVVRKEIKKILVPMGIFFSISISISLIFFIPYSLTSFSFNQPPAAKVYKQDTATNTTYIDKWVYLFVAADMTQRIAYPFLFHYIPFVYPRSPLAHHYIFFGYGTGVLFVMALLSIFLNKTWVKSIEKRLLVSSFVFTYLFPLHSIITTVVHFYPNRFVIFLELFSSLLFLSLVNKKPINRHNILFIIIWLILLFFSFRWYSYSIFFD